MHVGLLDTAGPLIVVLLGLAAWSDLAIRTIPDWICVALALAGLLIRGSAGAHALAISVGLAGVLFLALVFVHAYGGLGGGDVKLAAALVLGLPASGAYRFLMVTVLAGGVLGLLYLALRQLPAPLPCPSGASRLRRVWTAERWRIRRKGSLPYTN